jgi:hypothetical protein
VPAVGYGGLQTVLVKPPTKARLSEYLKKHANSQTYQDWAIETIKRHVEPGQRALVVTRLALIDQRYLPSWDRDDERWSRLETDPAGYHWDLEDRHVAVTYWGGDNIGNNAWQDADVVLLFDADHKPRRVVVADVQGMFNAKPTDSKGPLAAMTSVRRRHVVVDGYVVGGLLRAHKQLALRGRARRFDEHGVCGTQKVVCGLSDPQWLLENFNVMFPGAPPPVLEAPRGKQGKQTYQARLIDLLTSSDTPDTVSTAWVGQRLGRPWRDISRKVMTPAFKKALAAIGWSYGGRGKTGASFTRNAIAKLQAVLSSNVTVSP